MSKLEESVCPASEGRTRPESGTLRGRGGSRAQGHPGSHRRTRADAPPDPDPGAEESVPRRGAAAQRDVRRRAAWTETARPTRAELRRLPDVHAQLQELFPWLFVFCCLEGGGEGEREREPQADPTPSAEPKAGLELTTLRT